MSEAQHLPATIDGALEGEVLLRKDWREAGGRYGIGDFVTRDGTDIQVVLSLNGDGGDGGEFKCVKAPVDGWCEVGDVEFNLTRRYDPIDASGNAT